MKSPADERQVQIEAVIRFIHANPDLTLSRAELARRVSYSVPHFHRLFASSTGRQIADYVRSVRLQRAGIKLRHGAVNITELALASGYATHAAFGKAFKRQYGVSPAAFRRLGVNAASELLLQGKPR